MEFTADTILNMTTVDAGKAFAGDAKKVSRSLGRLAAKWHPDVCGDPRAKDVFAHIVELRDKIKGKPAASAPGRVLKTADGRSLKVDPLSTRLDVQGEVMVGKGTISTLFTAENVDLAKLEIDIRSRFRFASSDMEKQMEPSLPRIVRDEEMADGGRLVIARKERGEVLLADVIDARGAMPDVHAAWLGSGLLNIACWLEYSGLVHGAISPQTVLIDPETHSVRLAAGWCFATQTGTRPIALPGRTLTVLPRLGMKGEVTTGACDLELIRRTICEALGDPRGTSGTVGKLPSALSSWLRMPPAKTAVEDYKRWQAALVAAWGKRRFIDYPVRAADIYGARA